MKCKHEYKKINVLEKNNIYQIYECKKCNKRKFLLKNKYIKKI